LSAGRLAALDLAASASFIDARGVLIAPGFECEREVKQNQQGVDRDQPVSADEKSRQTQCNEDLCAGDQQPEHAAPGRGEPESHAGDKIEHRERDDCKFGVARHHSKDRLIAAEDDAPMRQPLKEPEQRDDTHEP